MGYPKNLPHGLCFRYIYDQLLFSIAHDCSFSLSTEVFSEGLPFDMSARSVVKTSCMSAGMQEFAITVAQDAIANFTTEQEIASSIKSKFERQYPST